MSAVCLRRRAGGLLVCAMALMLVAGPVSAAPAGADGPISVVVDQAKLIRLPDHVTTIVVGNPLIADVSLQPGGMVVVTGKGYGATNVIAMDRGGSVLVDRVVQVEGPSDVRLVTVYRGINRESYSCTPVCQKRVTLGDEKSFFSGALEQAGNLSNQAAGK